MLRCGLTDKAGLDFNDYTGLEGINMQCISDDTENMTAKMRRPSRCSPRVALITLGTLDETNNLQSSTKDVGNRTRHDDTFGLRRTIMLGVESCTSGIFRVLYYIVRFHVLW